MTDTQPRARGRVKLNVVAPSAYSPKPPTTMPELAKNKKYVGLFQMATRLTDHYSLDPPIQYRTPFGWWKYTKLDTISLPMPNPRAIIREKGGRPTPVWRWSEIVAWYAGYAGIAPRE